MKINRVWDMPNKHTFKIHAVRCVLRRFVGDGAGWLDPFANNHSPAEVTNDLNPDTNANYHMDAYEFLQMFETSSRKGILLDPPYSLHQVTVSYEGYGSKRVNALTPVYDEAARIVQPGGYVICFGWNSNGLGKSRHFSIEEIVIVPHGGHHNDTIITIERKDALQSPLFNITSGSTATSLSAGANVAAKSKSTGSNDVSDNNPAGA